jgi:cyclophilin family peptidyl-prolyl cis-trans isomerase
MTTRRILPIATSVALLCGTGLAGAAKIKAPTEPSNLTVKPLGVNSFELKWKDNSNNEIGWEIFAALQGSTPVRYQVLNAPNANSFVVVTNELPGKGVSFQVAAYNGTAAAPKSSKRTSVVSAVALSKNLFGAPTNLRVVVVDDGQVRLLWKDNATRETSYQVEYKLTSSKVWGLRGTLSPGTSFSLPAGGLLPLTGYSFRVRASHTYGGSPEKFTAYSNVVKAKTKAFQAPSNLVATPEGEGAFSFKWKDNSSIETGFELQRKIGTGDFIVSGTVPANSKTTDPVPDFVLNADYQFRLRSYRLVAGVAVYSEFSNVFAAKSTTLTKPATLAGTGTSGTSLKLTWTGTSLRATGYSVEHREAGTTGPFTTVNAGKVLTATVPNLAAGKLYEVRLKATIRDFFGNVTASSAYTPSIEVRTKDGILGNLRPPIILASSFLYPIQVSRVDALTNLTVTGLPTGLVYDAATRTISGSATEEGVKTVVLNATFIGGWVVSQNLTLRIVRPLTPPRVKGAFAAVSVAPAESTSITLAEKFEDLDTTSAARINTSSGPVDIILYPLATPGTVTNFLSYLNNGRYNNGFFHRSVATASGSLYIVQGGGYQFTPATGFTRVVKAAAILNEPGISNLEGTVAMAKVGGDANSATSEFFINLSDANASNLDSQNEGFTVFGRVTDSGLVVMKSINLLTKKNYAMQIGNTTAAQQLDDVPITLDSPAVTIDYERLVKMTTVTIPPLLQYEVVSLDPAVATAAVVGTNINITGVAAGSTSLTVKATDLDGQSVTQTVMVTVGVP